MYHRAGTVDRVARVQVSIDKELEKAIAEFGGDGPRSRTIRDLAMRGAEAMRDDREARKRAYEHLMRIARGEEDGLDFSVAERLHRERR